MKLTGKCKEDFEKWYFKQKTLPKEFGTLSIDSFYLLSLSMQYGVYVDFFDSVGIKVYVSYNDVAHKWNWFIDFNPVRDDVYGFPEFSLHEARTKAIEKANESYNQNH